MRLLYLSTVLAMALTACTTDALDKGLEDDVPADGKLDSFGTPTDHGELELGASNYAEITYSEGFHSWTFTLTDGAEIDLRTSVQTINLDTVMYLYRRTAAGWGAYIAKNDDVADNDPTSRLEETLTAGEYRVVVKGFKRTMRGEFTVAGSCSGVGCPTESACSPSVDLPDDTGYGPGCSEALANIFATAQARSTNERYRTLDQRCDATPLERLALDYYASYWEDLEAIAGDEPLAVTVSHLDGNALGGGSVVTVDRGGDETAATFVFDADTKLVAVYQHNQSPDVRFYCRTSGAPVSVPNVEDCMGALIGDDMIHEADDEVAFSLQASPNDLSAELADRVEHAVREYARARGTGASTLLSVEGALWDTSNRVTIQGSGKPATTYLTSEALVVLAMPADGRPTLVCTP